MCSRVWEMLASGPYWSRQWAFWVAAIPGTTGSITPPTLADAIPAGLTELARRRGCAGLPALADPTDADL